MIAMLSATDNASSESSGAIGQREQRSAFHEPVLLDETLTALEPGPGKIFVDGTLGGGGHAEAFLEAGARVVGLDQDAEALQFAGERLGRFGDNYRAFHLNFADVSEALLGAGVARIDGALLDLGVSSWQLDAPGRGFSFIREGPLDMRMNNSCGITAAELVNTAPAEELERIFYTFGEEPAGRRVASRIIADRARRPFESTTDLVESIGKVIHRRGRIHPSTRVFQALRIAVNRELEVLEQGLRGFSRALAIGGRFGVITFHSLEDRIVKHFFKSGSTEWLDRAEWPEPRRNPEFQFRLLTAKPLVASAKEQQRNPRSRSAKLRVVEKCNDVRQ